MNALKYFILLLLISSDLIAASYSCNGENVLNVDGATGNASASYSDDNVSVGAGGGRYFKFTTNTKGIITISQDTTANVYGYANHKILVGTSCGGSNIYNGSGVTNDYVTVDVNANTTYYVKIQEANLDNYLNVDTNFNFIANKAYSCGKPHAFTLRQQYILPGDLVAVGNSNICADTTPEDGICDDNQLQRNDTANIIFIDRNSSASNVPSSDNSLNTSEANLTIPAGATVKWAGLYWQGELWDIKNNTEYAKIPYAKQVNFKVPNSSSYTTLTADEFYYFFVKHNSNSNGDIKWRNKDRYEMHYQGFKDVTSLVQNAQSGQYWVANIQATIGKLWYPGVEAAWTLQVIYQYPTANPRSIAITDGYYGLYDDGVSGDNYANEINSLYGTSCLTGGQNTGAYDNNITFSVGGFLTPVDPGFTTDMSIFVTESDPDGANTAEFLNVTKADGSISPVDGPGAWNYEILDKNGSNNLDRKPAYIYPIGVTIKNYRKTDLLSTQQTSTDVTFSTGADRLMLGVVGFATDLRKPNLCYDYAYSQNGRYFTEDFNASKGPYLTGTVTTSDPVQMKLYVRNTENSDLIAQDLNISILDINTSQATYKANSTQILVPGSSYISNLNDSSLTTSSSYIKNIPIGTVKGNNYFYTYYQLNPLDTNLSMPINAKVDYTMTFPAGTGTITIPYSIYLNSDIPICTDSTAYSPTPGRFNVVYSNNYNLDQPGGTLHYYNLPTVVASRPDNYKVISLDPNNTDTLQETTTAVWVDLIDAGAFHDTQAACDESDNAISGRVLVYFDNNTTSTAFTESVINQMSLSQNANEFYQTARKNVAFRVSWNIADENNSIVKTHVITTGGHAGNIAVDNFSELAQGLINYNSGLPANEQNKCVQPVIVGNHTYTTMPESCGNSADTNGLAPQDLAICMQCVFGVNMQHVCSRDNFAIRPQAFLLKLNDQNQTTLASKTRIADDISGVTTPSYSIVNLASGYKYSLEANATNYINNNAVIGFSSSENNTSFIWEPRTAVSNCNDTADQNLSGSTAFLNFSNGYAEINASKVDQVGDYRLHAIDTTWTQVDSTPDATLHSGYYFNTATDSDCIHNNSNVPLIGSSTLNGCNISSSNVDYNNSIVYNDYNVTFHPYKFTLTITPTRGMNHDNISFDSNNTFIYMSDIGSSTDENMSLHLNGFIKAQGADDNQTTNFVNNCFAKPINIDINRSDYNTTAVAYQLRYHDYNSTGSENNDTYIDINNSTIPHVNTINSLALDTSHFLKDMNGEINSTMNLNFARNITIPVNPQIITFHDYNVSCQTPADCNFSADLTTKSTSGSLTSENNITDVNITVKYYYGRAHTPRYRFEGQDGNATVYFEVYCDDDGNKTLLPVGFFTKDSVDEVDWYQNIDHNVSIDGNITSILEDRTPTQYVVYNHWWTFSTHPEFQIAQLHYDGTQLFPYLTTMQTYTAGWLIYNKYLPTVNTNDFEVEFYKADGNWTGAVEGNTTAVDSNASSTTSKRVFW